MVTRYLLSPLPRPSGPIFNVSIHLDKTLSQEAVDRRKIKRTYRMLHWQKNHPSICNARIPHMPTERAYHIFRYSRPLFSFAHNLFDRWHAATTQSDGASLSFFSLLRFLTPLHSKRAITSHRVIVTSRLHIYSHPSEISRCVQFMTCVIYIIILNTATHQRARELLALLLHMISRTMLLMRRRSSRTGDHWYRWIIFFAFARSLIRTTCSIHATISHKRSVRDRNYRI